MVTIRLSLFSGRFETLIAAQMFAAPEIPDNIPSLAGNIFAISSASSFFIGKI